ncbi:hypothetical protein JCGZ_08661 [Jatropha curcas]|uniref:Uncharacterized protein n=1 Tax=Jatropha curcas TaxID=180498 RepID=A0A067KJT9_JATCU|nr:hypothetical protein JCGZ_08661 [Jatropha curcas]
MALKRIQSRRDERTTSSLHQLDPAFYKKIISRNSSARHSRQNSIYCSPIAVPFVWEIQPGKPRNVANHSASIRFPPTIHNLSTSMSFIPPSKGFLNNIKRVKKTESVEVELPPVVQSSNIPKPNLIEKAKTYFFKKVKKIKNMKIGLPPATQGLKMPTPNVTPQLAKAYFFNKIKKLHKVKKIQLRGRKKKNISHEIKDETNDSDDDFQLYFDCNDDFTSFSTPNNSISLPTPPSFPPRRLSPKISATKSTKILDFWRLRKRSSKRGM